ncbi:glycosyltransferase family 2 protein [Nodularia sp. UHCC 0506]|uniref:glycosyltransferase family 2 protein n=1 Tax=Nodularia sp. UHCC 0506 TaxID=3110243 RepID=UPI002B203663|nr:glycosyltransferase [Nodularia sp. UHCC 0506]MEA5513208.1 glycosyltransferase [Nodularia sp. UHCC 0506]
MQKLLTIAIPTYNRAELLDKQLVWLTQAIKGFESDCEIFVSDNCSTEHTQKIIKKWRNYLSNVTFKSHKQPENVGLIKNLISCLTSAETKYIWTIGDDDPIQIRAVRYLINKLKNQENLSLLFLNFSGRNKLTNEPVHPPTIVGNRWFDADIEDGNEDGKTIFEYCFAKSIGAVSFLTASVYRADLIKRALEIWPEAPNNWLSLAYLAGYCAANGQVIVTKDTYMECIVGVSYWQKEADSALLMQYKHIPEVIVKLEENGYSKEFCNRMILQNFKQVNMKVFLGGLRRWPVSAMKMVVPFLSLVCLSAFKIMLESRVKMGYLQKISIKAS